MRDAALAAFERQRRAISFAGGNAMMLRDFAKALGLSQTTVSRGLNDYPEVSPATRQRIREAAAELGYRPNANARRLAMGRTHAIGIALDLNAEVHMSEFMYGVGKSLADSGMDILVSPTETALDELTIYRRLAASKRVDAVILHSPFPNDARARLLTDIGLPFIVHGRVETETPVAWLDIDNEGAFRRATEHLLDLGHKRIAMVNGPEGRTFAEHRNKGYRDALIARGLRPDPRLTVHGRFTDEIGFRFAQSLLEQKAAPTAFLAGSMMTALGVFRAIRSAGLILGRDVSMIAHDDVFPFLNADRMAPTMSTTRSSMRAAGTRIAELLMQLLAGRPASEIHELWPVELVLRESTGPAPQG
jgi:LacI family transcriptional regulator